MSVSGCLALIVALGSAEMDLRSQKISNGWLLTAMLLGFLYQCFDPGGKGPSEFAAGSITPVLLLGGLFYFRMLGAGDIKLLSALGGIMGDKAIRSCVLWSVIFGAVISVMILCVCGCWLQRLLYFTDYIKRYLTTKTRKPYRLKGQRQEHFHFSVPVLMGVLLWIGGFY